MLQIQSHNRNGRISDLLLLNNYQFLGLCFHWSGLLVRVEVVCGQRPRVGGRETREERWQGFLTTGPINVPATLRLYLANSSKVLQKEMW